MRAAHPLRRRRSSWRRPSFERFSGVSTTGTRRVAASDARGEQDAGATRGFVPPDQRHRDALVRAESGRGRVAQRRVVEGNVRRGSVFFFPRDGEADEERLERLERERVFVGVFSFSGDVSSGGGVVFRTHRATTHAGAAEDGARTRAPRRRRGRGER